MKSWEDLEMLELWSIKVGIVIGTKYKRMVVFGFIMMMIPEYFF